MKAKADSMEFLIKQIIDYIDTNNKRLIIGISGHGASGKSTFAENLCEQLNDGYNYLNTDSYIISSEYRRFTIANYQYQGKNHTYKVTACMPVAHELNSLTRDVEMLRQGEGLITIDTSWAPSERLEADKQLIIVEGMSAAFIDSQLFDLNIYIYTDAETEFKRRAQRDVNERGRKLEDLESSHIQRRIQYELFMHAKSENFDVVVDNSNDEFKVVTTCFSEAES